MIRAISRNALALAAVATLCVALLGTLNVITAPKIAEQRLLSQLAILNEVLPSGTDTRRLLSDCLIVNDVIALGRPTQKIYRWREDDIMQAYLLETTAPDGYSGNIDLLVAVTPTGTVLGSRVLNHQETPGLGDKIETRRSDWMLSFNNKSASINEARRWAVTKDGGEFDQFTGATITPRAVINAVYRAALFVQQHPELATAPANCELLP